MSEPHAFALVPNPPGAIEKAGSGENRILSGMVADTLALSKTEPPVKPVFTVLVCKDHFADIYRLVIKQQLGQQYDLQVIQFERATELLKLAEEHEFDLIALYLGNVSWDTGSGNGRFGSARDVLGNLYSKYGKPIFATQGLELTQEFEGTGVTFVGAPYELHGFRNVVRASLALKQAHRILLVDDEPLSTGILAAMIRHWLREAEVLTFQDGNQAWQELQRHPPDLLITDMNRPGLSGWKMLPLLAEKKVEFPILVVSGNATEEGVSNCAGPNLNVTRLPKPFTVQQLRLIVSQLLGLSAKPSPEVRESKP